MIRSPPTARRYLVNDATLEKLGEILKENPNGVTLFRDELTGWLKSMDKQGHESDRGFYLEAWNGNGCYTWDRIGPGNGLHPECMRLCLRHDPARSIESLSPAHQSAEKRRTASFPDSRSCSTRIRQEKFIHVDRYPDSRAKNEAYAVFKKLDQLDPAARGCPFDEEREIPYLNFSAEAQDFFDDWRINLENRLRSDTLSNVMECHLAKYRSLLPSLALQFPRDRRPRVRPKLPS